MIIGACTIITGTCIQAPSINEGMFLGGRFILGFGVAICATAGPSYVVEMAHPAWRGPITGVYNTFWFVGAIPASYITYGTNKNFPTSNLAWRLPIWLQMTFSGFVVVGSIFAPEVFSIIVTELTIDSSLAVLAR
jgi:MFS family permease